MAKVLSPLGHPLNPRLNQRPSYNRIRVQLNNKFSSRKRLVIIFKQFQIQKYKKTYKCKTKKNKLDGEKFIQWN